MRLLPVAADGTRTDVGSSRQEVGLSTVGGVRHCHTLERSVGLERQRRYIAPCQDRY